MNKRLFLIIILFFSGLIYGQKSEIIGSAPSKLEIAPLDEKDSAYMDLLNMKDEVVLLDFWATWCSPCIQAFPHMNDLVEKYKDKKLKVISITYEPESKIIPLLKKNRLNTIIAMDNDFRTFRKYNAWAIPNIILIGRDGKISGRIHPNQLNEKVIDDLLNGRIPDVEQTPENLFKPDEAEKYFRSTLEEKK
ncbi:MAG: TlpA disulfide reductase family protein [Ignavibacteriales bacterium]|nr:TlpA disulfide reductase family protein [Ignavibacteriales bacterium]